MYLVFFGLTKFAEFDNDVNACAVALDLHRISNLPHKITVNAVVDGMVEISPILDLQLVDKDGE